MRFSFIDKNEYDLLLCKSYLNEEDKFKLATYPFSSLTSYCGIKYYDTERKEVERIEERNIYHFFNAINVLFNASIAEDATFINSFKDEPLRTAVILANQERDASLRVPLLLKYACLILLSIDKKGTNRNNPINVRIVGRIPFDFFFFFQKRADLWFHDFVTNKLDGMCKICKDWGLQDAFIYLYRSIAYSLKFFFPEKYDTSWIADEDEAIKFIIKKFVDDNEDSI